MDPVVMEAGVVGFCLGLLMLTSIYAVGGWSGEAAERNARIRRAALRARELHKARK